MNVGVTIPRSEMNKLKIFFDKVNAQYGSKVKRNLAIAGLEMESVAKMNAPVGTPESTGIKGYIGGTLKQSIKYLSADNGFAAKASTRVIYAPYVEFGTWKMKARPFMGKGLYAGRRMFINLMSK